MILVLRAHKAQLVLRDLKENRELWAYQAQMAQLVLKVSWDILAKMELREKLAQKEFEVLMEQLVPRAKMV